MIKKILILFLVLVCFTSLAVAIDPNIKDNYEKISKNSFEYYQIPVDYHQGWNIIPLGTSFYSLYENSPEAMNQWRYSLQYRYLPIENSYLGFKDSKEEDQVQFIGFSSKEEFVQKTEANYPIKMGYNLAGQWAYFTKDITLTHSTFVDADFNSYAEYASYGPGWHFMVVPLEIVSGELSFGDCEFDKVYHWESEKQKWDTVGMLDGPLLVGQGVVFHVNEECTFGPGSLNSNSPPAMPN